MPGIAINNFPVRFKGSEDEAKGTFLFIWGLNLMLVVTETLARVKAVKIYHSLSNRWNVSWHLHRIRAWLSYEQDTFHMRPRAAAYHWVC